LLDWEEEVEFNRFDNKDDKEETESILYCKKSYYSDYKYNIFYEIGKNYTFPDKSLVDDNNYYAGPLYNKIIEVKKGINSKDWNTYTNHIGLFFFFIGCAGISIIVWIFNWICWLNQCCCCDFLHNPVNKRIAWWASFTLLLGILACCISGFVSVNRFGFALEGSRCAFDRIYYDALYGQLKNNTPRWEGLESTKYTLKKISEFCEALTVGRGKDIKINIDKENKIKRTPENLFKISLKNLQESCNLEIDPSLIPDKSDFIRIKDDDIIFMDYFQTKGSILKGFLNILAMIYFCLFLITVVAAGVSMMFYACLKRQGYLITFMHILWNVMRFFIFSFFLYGNAYGVFYDILSDLIGAMKMIFVNNLNPKNLEASESSKYQTYKFLSDCLSLSDPKDSTVTTLFLDDTIRTSIFDFFTNFDEPYTDENGLNINKTLCNDQEYCTHLNATINKVKNFMSFDCSFLKSDLHHLYKALNDASLESQKLAAISLCSAFFGAISVYFYLLVIHHYNNELFFDSGKSIFTGFDGFGRGYKNKNRNNDPAYKKRKLRAEIELTSKNDDQNEYKNMYKNDDD